MPEDHGQWDRRVRDRRGLLLPVQHAAMSHSIARSAVRMLKEVCSVLGQRGLLAAPEPWGEADSYLLLHPRCPSQ